MIKRSVEHLSSFYCLNTALIENTKGSSFLLGEKGDNFFSIWKTAKIVLNVLALFWYFLSLRAVKPLALAMGIQGASFCGEWRTGVYLSA